MARIKDNSDAFKRELEQRIKQKLGESAAYVEREAKEIVPRKTGTLARSINHDVDGNRAVVGSNIEYAPHVEYGTAKMGAKPFLRPALKAFKAQFSRIWKK